MSIEQQPWGETDAGTSVSIFTLRTPSGLEARITNFGGIVTHLLTPDREGTPGDVVLGHDTLKPYLGRAQSPYFGALIGRHANRIARGRFELDGQTYQLPVNNGPNSLHGGPGGFDQVVWQAEPIDGDEPSVRLTYVSPDGEEGYPGTLTAVVTYTLTTANELRLHYRATTSAPTIVNLTNHSYFNLTGDASRDVLDHELTIAAEAITPIDETLIPTGDFQKVDGTPFDFRTPRKIGERVNDDDEQLRFAGGYDHNFVLAERPRALAHVARLFDSASGRVMDVATTQPGVQFYSGNFLDGSVHGKDGRVYEHRWALCLETQHFPDTPNQPRFPSTVLRPGEVFESTTVYAFSVSSGR
ncbi:aldose epimerase family protein [Deinococcus yavapaiensis]|uniref:Aldose 1-epimerase n=1 Tax=Deinococcus yavapaiensis KR-236 TaxID=694435 RepID=A0A318SDD7_9DEIO|nr:aldose epimerase family protein [Deinococcus yavapaiensis]PYE56653.1 aldose 1-epimerase [Deinococcus yavapaiensis KR-236]